MAVRNLDLAARKAIVARMPEEKEAARKRHKQARHDSDRRWKLLVMSTTAANSCMCHCRDVKLGYVNVCPAHALSLQLPQSVH